MLISPAKRFIFIDWIGPTDGESALDLNVMKSASLTVISTLLDYQCQPRWTRSRNTVVILSPVFYY